MKLFRIDDGEEFFVSAEEEEQAIKIWKNTLVNNWGMGEQEIQYKIDNSITVERVEDDKLLELVHPPDKVEEKSAKEWAREYPEELVMSSVY